jgi:hypothetical protein
MRGTAGLSRVHAPSGTLLDAVDAVAKDRPLSILESLSGNYHSRHLCRA